MPELMTHRKWYFSNTLKKNNVYLHVPHELKAFWPNVAVVVVFVVVVIEVDVFFVVVVVFIDVEVFELVIVANLKLLKNV